MDLKKKKRKDQVSTGCTNRNSWAIWVNIVKYIYFLFINFLVLKSMKMFWYLIIDWFICDPWRTEIGVIRGLLLFHIGMADW